MTTTKTATRVAARAVHATKIYGADGTAVRALDDVSVDLAGGRFTAVMGPSGSALPARSASSADGADLFRAPHAPRSVCFGAVGARDLGSCFDDWMRVVIQVFRVGRRREDRPAVGPDGPSRPTAGE